MARTLDGGAICAADLQQRAGRGWSVLYGDHPAPEGVSDLAEPAYFQDLNLDKFVTGVTGKADEYKLTGYLRHALDDPELISFRQAVFTDVETDRVRAVIDDFGDAMRTVRQQLGDAQKRSEYYESRRWQLDASTTYCEALCALQSDLADADPLSTGLQGISTYLRGYLDSETFRALTHARSAAIGALATVQYAVLLEGARITVAAYDDEPDYSVQVTDTFARFRNNDGEREAEVSVPRHGGSLDRVEAGVLTQAAHIFPDHFAVLDRFCADHGDFLDPTVVSFDAEIRFYLMFEDYLAQLRDRGLPLTMPVLTSDHTAVKLLDVYDLPLAVRCGTDQPVVLNDVTLQDPERILVVSGPNNGGKTTLARTVGQLHHLARLGCPVPGREVQIMLCDAIHTHFERQEDLTTLAGRLQNELDSMHSTLAVATDRSVIIMNEMFSSTTVDDAQYLSRAILTRVTDLGAVAVCVTFLEELSTLNESTVSMVSLVDPNDAGHRTFQVVRQRADGRAYARALAAKYGLTHDQVSERVGS
ncbi:hypothetical protein V3G39_03710 [Dermatophilaceae bacterium Sec6.4]